MIAPKLNREETVEFDTAISFNFCMVSNPDFRKTALLANFQQFFPRIIIKKSFNFRNRTIRCRENKN